MPTDWSRSRGGLTGLTQPFSQAVSVLGADAAADLREVVGRLADLVGLLQPSLGGQHQPVGDVVVHRAMHLAEGHAALRAARRLLGRRRRVVFLVDLAEVLAPRGDIALVRHTLVDVDEFQHAVGHTLQPFGI